eukprot:3556563-Prymnesium_polylepis.2
MRHSGVWHRARWVHTVHAPRTPPALPGGSFVGCLHSGVHRAGPHNQLTTTDRQHKRVMHAISCAPV